MRNKGNKEHRKYVLYFLLKSVYIYGKVFSFIKKCYKIGMCKININKRFGDKVWKL